MKSAKASSGKAKTRQFIYKPVDPREVKRRIKERFGVDDPNKGRFLSQKEAEQRLSYVYGKVDELVNALPESPVDGWFSRLNSWLSRMARGNYDPHRTPIFEDLTFAQVAHMIMGFVSNQRNRLARDLGPLYTEIFLEVEAHQAEKIGPRGCFPDMRDGWIEEFFDKVWSDKPPKKELDKAAIAESLRWFASLIPAHSLDIDDATIDKVWSETLSSEDGPSSESALNTDTNSCFPDYVHKWLVFDDPGATDAQRAVSAKIRRQVTMVYRLAMKAKSYKEILPYLHFVATANQRTNVSAGYVRTDSNTYRGKLMSKLRGVVAMPKMDTCLGKALFIKMLPAIRKIKNQDGTPVFLGLFHPAVIDKACQQILETASRSGLVPLSIDYSAFDSTIPPWLMWEVAKAAATWMSHRMANLWLALVYAFIYQTTLISLSKIYPEGPSSMKSGSWLTNMMDSFVNLVVQRYGLEAGHYKSLITMIVHGDDGIMTGVGVTPDTYEPAADAVGLSANKDKQFYRKDSLAFCQKVHFRGLPGGIYPISRATAAIISKEDDDVRLETDKDVVGQFPYVLAYRTICRMETAAFNPEFARYVNLVADNIDGHLFRDMPANRLAKLAGTYADKYQAAVADKPWKGLAMGEKGGFAGLCVNRVLHGEVPPKPGRALFEWVYNVNYDSVTFDGPNEEGEWAFVQAA